jgi:hypothetical protein
MVSDQLDAPEHGTDGRGGDQTGTDQTQIDDDAHGCACKTYPLDQTQSHWCEETP